MTRIGIKHEHTASGIDYTMCLNEKAIGTARVIFHNEHEYELSEVEIKPKHRNKGLGKKLVQFVAYHVPHHQLFLASVIPDFYEKLGWQRLSSHPSFVDHTHKDCQLCDPEQCISMVFKKPPFLISLNGPQSHDFFDYLQKQNPMICEFSHVNLRMWKEVENNFMIEIEGYWFMISFSLRGMAASIPPQPKIPEPVFSTFLARCRELGVESIKFLSWHAAQQLEDFEYFPEPSEFDYLYKSRDFADYAGGRFRKKRNRIAKFLRHFPEHRVIEYRNEHKNDIINFVKSVIHKKAFCCDTETVLESGLNQNLLTGFFVTVNDDIAGALFYSQLNARTIDVHFEFSAPHVDGLSPFMNNHLGKHVVDRYPFINREQDWGLPGLRKSKYSYRPIGQIRKYAVKL